MFRLPQKPTRRLALLLLFPALLVLSYFVLARSTNRPVRSSAHTPEAAVERSETKAVSDLDHDGLPDVAELRTFNDRENFRRWFTWVVIIVPVIGITLAISVLNHRNEQI